MNNYSDRASRNLLATSADEPFLILLEITHPELEVPVRVVNDTQNITIVINHQGTAKAVEFIACPFDIKLPDDVGEQVPSATLTVDNIGRELTQWLEYSRGGAGAKCRVLQVLRSEATKYSLEDFEEYAENYFAEDFVRQLDVTDWQPFEYDITLDMSGISVTNLVVSAELGFQNTLMQSAVTVRYDTITSPGLF